MNLITQEQFINKKKSDTIVILGSGYSINYITPQQWDFLSKFDSMAFNWFAFHSFEPSFYIIREQANIKSRRSESETPEIFVNLLKKYKKTCGVILDVKQHTKKSHDYTKDERIKLSSIILQDNIEHRYRRRFLKIMRLNPFEVGLFHGLITLTGVLHLIAFLGYKRIIFAGIDLYDSRYFWLRKDKTRHTVKRKGMVFKNKHAIANKVLKTVKVYKNICSDMFSVNPNSLLVKSLKIPVFEFNN